MLINSINIAQIVTNIEDEEQIQQVSIDLRLDTIDGLITQPMIFKEKTVLPLYESIEITTGSFNGKERELYVLSPGYYRVTFMEGIELPPNKAARISQRSSLLRSGTMIQSSLYDPNFKTEKMGAFMLVSIPIEIERGTRIASIVIYETEPVPEILLYKGQYQGK